MTATTPTNRVAAGVPTGGQFAASARTEAGISLGPLDVHVPVDDVDTHSTCPATWGEKCREHRTSPGIHVGDMEIRACVEGADEVFSNAPEAKAEFFTLYTADANGLFMATDDYDTREQARDALRAAVEPKQPAVPAPQESVADLGAAVAGYRMNRAAARVSIDAYNEAVTERPAVTGPQELARRKHSLDLAALTTYTSLHALRPDLNADERQWVDRLGEVVEDEEMGLADKANRLDTVIKHINIGSLEREVLRRRALDPDDQVFGSDRPEAARYARHELAQAEAAYEAAGGGWNASDEVTARLHRARACVAKYPGYTD